MAEKPMSTLTFRAAGALVAAALFLLAHGAPAAEPAKPNIVIFLSDDQGWGDLSLTGNTNLRTPNIDARRAGDV